MLCGKPVFSLVNFFSEALHMHQNTARSRRHTSHSTSSNSLGIWEKTNLINMVFFCFSWLHRPIDEDSPPGCLPLPCKYPPFQLKPFVLLLVKLCFGFFLLGILGCFFFFFQSMKGKDGNGISQWHPMLAGPWSIFAWKYYSIIQTMTWCQKLFSISRLPPSSPLQKKRTKKPPSVPTVPSNKNFQYFRKTEAFFWLQYSENNLNRSYLTGMFLSTTFMKTFGVILKAYTVPPSALHSQQTLLNGTRIPLSNGLFPLQKEVFFKSRKCFS